ncbi:hypothetical protein MKX01_040872 [Papaver californicum]|nr:hypothetical protein MKX01_040872 [Papaver californicum]
MDRGLSIPFRVYEDFQPLSSFIHEDNSDTLTLTLPGFRKEQIKVQIDSFGTLKITGEKPLGVSNKWSRFRKDFRTPANCKTGEIRAKFENEVLNIIMPKTTTSQPPKPAVNVTSPSRPSDQVAPPTSTNPTPKTTTTTPSHDHKPTSTESPNLPPPTPMVAPPSQKPTTEARVSPNKTVVPPSRKPANEANFSPMKPVAPPNQKPVAEPILPTPKPQPPHMSAGTPSNAEALLPRKNPAHDYEDRKTAKTGHHHHHHNPEEKKKWTSSSGSGSSSSSNTSTEDDSDDEHKHEHNHHEHVDQKGRKEDEVENYVHGGDGAVVGKLKKKKDELIQKMSDYRRQSGTSGGGMNMTSMMENYKNKFERFMMEMKKKKNSSSNDGEINRSDLVVNMAVASLVVAALGVYVTWSFKSIYLE